MAKRDPYHQSSARFAWCRCCSDIDDVRLQIRRARHTGKRETHAAVIGSQDSALDRWLDAHDDLDDDYEHPWEIWPTCEYAEPVCVPERLATIGDALLVALA